MPKEISGSYLCVQGLTYRHFAFVLPTASAVSRESTKQKGERVKASNWDKLLAKSPHP